jgi:hypothetical protein
MLGVRGALKAAKDADPWVAAHAGQLLACLPGQGAELSLLAAQLGLEFRPESVSAGM